MGLIHTDPLPPQCDRFFLAKPSALCHKGGATPHLRCAAFVLCGYAGRKPPLSEAQTFVIRVALLVPAAASDELRKASRAALHVTAVSMKLSFDSVTIVTGRVRVFGASRLNLGIGRTGAI